MGRLLTMASMTRCWVASFCNRHTFVNPKGGQDPAGPLTLDSNGNLVGTTVIGGAYAAGTNGTIYEIKF